MEKRKVLVSMIVPVYNGEVYLQECLDSLLAQTYENIQIVVVNDGSTDTTKEIVEAYVKKDNRIVLVNQENQGTSAARNTGMGKAVGDYITFVDSDDYLLPDCIEKVICAINNTPEASLIVWNSKTFGDGKSICSGELDSIYSGLDYAKHVIHNRGGAGGVCCKAYRANIIRDNELRFANVKTAEDGLFNTVCLKYLKVVVSMSYVGYMYRKEDYYIHSTTKFFNREGFFRSSIESATLRLHLLRETMNTFSITDEKYKKLYYQGEFYTFEVVKDENMLNNKNFLDLIKCNKLLLEKGLSLAAIESQENVWCKKWLCHIWRKKSGWGLLFWQFTQIHYIKVMMINIIFGRCFPKNTARGKAVRKILGR